ncbi:MAG TPA: dihydrodipicolinate synthase family protein [Acetobacteraceae bacterium]|nr:dihydrodipicolinate synthase family protein [Acetobacteraceae bacterium]
MAADLNAGVIPAPVMPFTENGAADWTTLETYIAQVAAAGPRAIAMNMAASEGGSLSQAEQLEVIRRSKAAAAGCPIVSGVLSTYTEGAKDVARRVVDAGADGIVVFPALPTFISKPVPVSMIADYHAAIAEAVDVPVLAFQTANAAYPVGTMAALGKIERLVAIKDAAFDIDRTAELLEEAEPTGIKVLTGNDTFILEAMLLGCAGALIGFAGTATAELIRMQLLAAEGKATEAYAIWNRLGPLARVCWRAPLRDYRVRMKYVLMRQGVIPNMVARAPQPGLTDRDRADLDRVLERYRLLAPEYLPCPPATRMRAAS